VYRAVAQGFTKLKDPANLIGDEVHYKKWNAKARNALSKDVFNRVRNHKNAHALWLDICALFEETKSECEERYHLMIKSLIHLRCFLVKVLMKCILTWMFL
jgi:hypothetical protein